MTQNYDDIINLPHPVLKHKPKLSLEQRSAQFAPFAALTGFEEEIFKAGQIVETQNEYEPSTNDD